MLRIFFTLIFSLGWMGAFAQADPVEGYWLNDSKEAKIHIYKATDGNFWGKIVWLKEPDRDGRPKLDINNTNKKLRSRPVMGMTMLSRFKKDGDREYTGGEIYDPKNGKTYSCNMKLKDRNTLSIRGYIGISLIGRTTVWTRTTP